MQTKLGNGISRRAIIGVVGVAVLLIGWWVLHDRAASSPSPASGGPSGRRGSSMAGSGPVPVIAEKVAQKDIPIYLDGLGTVQAFNTVAVHTRIDGQLDKVLFFEGQDVKTGDLLAMVDQRPYQAALDQAIAKKAQDEAQLANAKVTLARNTDLLSKKVIDQQDFDTSKYQTDQFQAAVQADQASIESARTNLDYTQIKSPIDGRVGVRLIDVGNIVHAADANGIVVITQLQPISVLFTLPEENLPSILNAGGTNGGLKVAALDRGNTNILDDGTLAVVDNQIDQTTGTVKLKATFPNADLKLWPGKFVNARLVLSVAKDATVIPSSVVQRGPQGTYAYVIRSDKTVEMRPITVGQTEGNLALVEDGLKPGEEVVVDGQYKLQPGARVEASAPKSSVAQTTPGATAGPRRPGKS
jgi:multidrug efflux system membrane fusion protein